MYTTKTRSARSGNRVNRSRSGGQRRSYSSDSAHRGGGRNASRPSGRPQSSGRGFGRGNAGRGGNRGGGRGNKRALTTFNPQQFINKNPVERKEVVYTPTHTFADFGLDERLSKTVAGMGIKTPSPIQDQAIPTLMEGKDVVGLAETGTGKTIAFLLPLIDHKIHNMREITLILTPTRELAIQVDNEFRLLSRGFRMFSTVCVGGTSIVPQLRGLRKTNQFIIGTPGRIKDLMERGALRTDQITSVVLDEADRMLDMGFIHDMKTILGALPRERHTLFFSATMDDKTGQLVHQFMNNPTTISVKKKDVTDSIEQDVVQFQGDRKYETLVELLQRPGFDRVMIFGAMKHAVEKLSEQLNKSGIGAESIHGNKNHGQRQRALKRFKAGEAQVLVATDVAARGIHVDNVTHVINYELPNTFEDYVHRIGRTGRGTQPGKALTFVPRG